MSKVTFNNKQNPFFKTVKEKVDDYFKLNNIHTAGNSRLYLKSSFQVLTAIVLYTTLVFFTPSLIISLLLCVLLGLNFAVIGFNVMHEGGHQTFSKHKWLNSTSAYFLNALGGNTYFWKIKHNVNHHTYTNIQGLDSDIEVEPFMRLSENQPRYWFHKFQHIYWFFLYGISYMAWIFFQDFQKYFSGKISTTSMKKLDRKEHVIFWATKVTYLIVYLVLPIIMIGFLKAILGFVIVAFACGLFISVVFQLAHVVEGTEFPNPDSFTNRIEKEWAVHQVNTTANFDTKNKLVSWALGGLNFQVEHHLFPKISHIHYPKISEIVKETCAEFNIRYIEYPSIFNAFHSHLVHIKRLGRA